MSDMEIKLVEVTHVGFLHQTIGNWTRRQAAGEWEKLVAEEVLRAAGTQSAAKYIGRQKSTVTQCVSLLQLLEVCVQDNGYKGGGRKRLMWWRQGTT